MLIHFVGALFLARLLTPREIGIFSVAYVFAGLFRTLREMGLGAYIVQEPDLTDERFRTVLGLALCVAIATGALLILLAPYVSDFYLEPGMNSVLYVIAASFMLVPFGASSMSFLRRKLKFREIAIADTTGALVQNIIAIVLAWQGHGFMSLAWASLAGIAGTVAVIVYYRPPRLPWLPSLKEWRRVFGFSSFVSGSSLVNHLDQSASDLVLGRALNMESVALLNRANGLTDVLTNIVLRTSNTISLPYLSAQQREGTPLAPGFLHVTAVIAAIAVPFFSVLAIVAEPVILILFGDQWTASAPLLQILCLAAIARVPSLLTNHVMTALAAVKQQLQLDTQALFIKLAAILGCAPFGLQAVAWGFFGSVALTSALRIVALAKHFDIQLKDFWTTVSPSIPLSLISMIGPVVISTTDMPTIWLLGSSLLLASVGWLVAVRYSSNPISRELQSVLRLYQQRRSS